MAMAGHEGVQQLLFFGTTTFAVFALVSSILCIPSALASITIPEYGVQYRSAPALFGMRFRTGREYFARLQSFHKVDPYLCDWENIDDHSKEVVVPKDRLPVALLVRKGHCSFEEKARIAQRLHSAIKYVVVYDDNSAAQNLIKMTAQDPNGISLGLLFVSYASGEDLILRYSEQRDKSGDFVKEGLRVYVDGRTPWESITYLIWVLCAMTSVFLFRCLSGCTIEGRDRNVRVIIVNGNRQLGQLLTPEEAQKLPEVMYWNDDEEGTFVEHMPTDMNTAKTSSLKGSTSSMEFENYSCCSICLEDFEVGEKLLLLPKCHHYFHSDCIIPWLTERHPTCPLCKANVKENLKEEGDEHSRESEDYRRDYCAFCCCGRRRIESNVEEQVEEPLQEIRFVTNDNAGDHDLTETSESSSSSNSLVTPLLADQFL